MPDGPERLPSDRPGPCGPSRLHHVRFYTRAASPRTLSLAASLAHLVKGWGVASSYPSLARLASRRAERGDGKMRLPTSATDLRHEHPADPSIPRRFPWSLTAFRVTRVELRLTATLQLQPCRNLSVVALGVLAPDAHPGTTPPGPGGAAIDSPSGRRSRSRCFRPRAEHAT